MSSVNKVMLIGHLRSLPQLTTDKSKPYTIFELGTSESIPKRGKKIEHTEWHRIVMIGSQAEMAVRLLRLESLVLIEGKLQTRSFQEGSIVVYQTEIIAFQFKIVGRKSDF